MPGIYTQSMPLVQPGTSGVTTLTGLERIPADTQLAAGGGPETVAPTAFQVAALGAGMIYNSGTLSSNTATVNTHTGVILTGSLSTAAGSTYSFTIVNSLATTGTPYVLQALRGSSTTGVPVIQSATIANSGTISVVLKNGGTAVFNGTLLIPFQVGASGA